MEHAILHDLPHGLTRVDVDYVRPGLAAGYVMAHNGRGAIIETGTRFSAPRFLDALDRAGVARENVDYIFITHVHLDHAGGAGALLESLPNAKLVVHPRGARHMIDPSKLIAGSIAVYGEEKYFALYGEIVPAPAERVIESADGMQLELAGRPLELLHVEGHAKHHYVVWDDESRGLFTGDAFGISYREFDHDGAAWIYPTTTPVQFDPDAAHAAIDRLADKDPQWLYLTHFDALAYRPEHRDALHAQLQRIVALCRNAPQAPGAERTAHLSEGMRALFLEFLERAGAGGHLDLTTKEALMAPDIVINVQGLEVWMDKLAAAKQ
ncbi:MBL fold metallo-hydrolase [Magnetofaba australis]|uniref:Putative beta-lactamase domain-containing protein n=1 Tax=Magnetofaba australis IT-1 TaxID=1434232 RepID=A0A1Y2K544_9PROT|nr:MBL fold metallo-hydrolase [Magnetofaba australis]OSM04445.1 putative beta-lactamase domain-containing protein [Magnetofaba australis IT-1]